MRGRNTDCAMPKTRVIAFRLLEEDAQILDGRVKKWNGCHRFLTAGGYLRGWLHFELNRDHHKRKR